VRDILSIFFYKKRVFVATFLGVLLVTLAVALLSPPRYETSADLLIKPALTKPFAFSAEGAFFTADVTLKDLNTVIFLLQSSEHLAQVVAKLRLANRDDPEAMQKAVAALKSRLKAEPLTESNVVRVTLKGGDPQEITKILTALTQNFVDYYIEINRISGGIEFFRNQTEYLQRRLAQLNRELEQISAQTEVVDPAVQRQTLLQLLRDLEQERMKLLSLLEQLRAKTNAFSEALKRFESPGSEKGLVGLPKTAVYEYPALIEMEKSLAQLTINLQRARNDYQPGSKPVQDAEAQYANMRQQIRQYLRQIIEDLRVEERSSAAALAALEQRIADLNQRAVQLTGRSLSYEQLQLERELTQKQYGLYVDKQEEARIRQAKDDARFANVTIAAHPQLPAAPTFPRPGLMLALALLVGPIVAAGIAAAAYLAEQRIYTPSDAAAIVPLLGTLDETPRAHLPPTHQLQPLRAGAYHETF
jgi:uncharacterized protein involved in exopolysaccharide biosynthesis